MGLAGGAAGPGDRGTRGPEDHLQAKPFKGQPASRQTFKLAKVQEKMAQRKGANKNTGVNKYALQITSTCCTCGVWQWVIAEPKLFRMFSHATVRQCTRQSPCN